jgi:hypothetical protein
MSQVNFGPYKAAKINAALFKELTKIWNQGIGVFVDVLARRVHVDTGESIASLTPLAEAVGTSIPFSVRLTDVGIKKSLNRLTGKPTATNRTPGSGRTLGNNAFDITFDSANLSFGFRFSIPTFQFAVHDEGKAHRAKSGTMLGASDAALSAMIENVNLNVQTSIVPIVERWVATGDVRIETF